MPRYPYGGGGALQKPLGADETGEDKLHHLMADLGLDPKSRRYKQALLKLAERHVPGFKPSEPRKCPGRKSALEAVRNEVRQVFGLEKYSKLADEIARRSLRKMVDGYIEKYRHRSGRKFGISEVLAMFAETEPTDNFGNPFFGLKETTLRRIYNQAKSLEEEAQQCEKARRKRLSKIEL